MFEENSEDLVQSKLLILYILDKVDIPMINNDITQFILEQNYMNYFFVQQFLGELVNSKFIEITTKDGYEYYNLSKAGKDTLSLFSNKLPDDMKKSIDETYEKKRKELVLNSQIIANYFKKCDGEYIIILKVIEKESVIFSLTLNVPSSEQAKLICNNWKANSNEIYSGIMTSLISDYVQA